MHRKPVVSIVTPCFNAEKYIQMTVESVLEQTAFKSGRAILDYIIVDGGSADGTVALIESIVSAHILKDCVSIISEPDTGMYDALVKGMKQARGDIFAYINADDYYHKTAVDIVVAIMKKYSVKWLTGWEIGYNEYGHITSMDSQYLFRKKFIAQGVYGVHLPHLQQESTFWRRELNQKIDFEYLRTLRYAGDYYIWTEFAKENPLYVVETYLGGFRKRAGQLSGQMEKYNAEKFAFVAERTTILDKVLIAKDKAIWKLNKLNKLFNCVRNDAGEYVHFVYDHTVNEWVPLSMEWVTAKIKSRIFRRKT